MLRVERVSKSFGNKNVLDSLSLDIEEGKVFTLLGASGCGKTTLLRMIAGLDQPDEGSISSEDVTWVSTWNNVFVPPQKRNIGLVFQSYAIWPHMTVFDQVAYPLRHKRMSARVIRQRVDEMLDVVGLSGLEDRPGPMLSGGQQQRVALARALAPAPRLLLLDEPFSNLDVELRVQLRPEIKRIQRHLGITVVLVTHDQLDAFTLSDQVAVLQSGRIEQVGSCRNIYESPANEFVRGFIGRSSRLKGEVANLSKDNWTFRLPGGLDIDLPMTQDILKSGEPINIWFRPEDLLVTMDKSSEHNLMGEILEATYLGDRYEYIVRLTCGQLLVAHGKKGVGVGEGCPVNVAIQGVARICVD